MKRETPKHAYDKDVLVIKSAVRNWYHKKGFRMDDKTPRAVNDALIEILEKSTKRSKSSKRKTVTPKDV